MEMDEAYLHEVATDIMEVQNVQSHPQILHQLNDSQKSDGTQIKIHTQVNGM